jgi:hypothetical protein
MKRMQFILLILLALIMLIAVMWMEQQPATTSAQGPSETMRALIQETSAQGKVMVFTFGEPIAPSVTVRESNGQDLQVGDDYICFSEPWNDGRRFRCTPYSNIVSLSFLD